MKIKEVITKTGLTDRAIRLYIENELVKPEFDENYNGRKSIDFSENDVEQLKNIALLRKADFSIQEIKALQEGGEAAQNTIKEYINRTNEKIQLSSEILEKIGALSDEENITIETVCEKLSSSVSNAEVPAEDMELSPKEKKEKTVFTVISVIGMVLSALASACIGTPMIGYYKYPSFGFGVETGGFWLSLLMFLFKYFLVIQFLICLLIYIIYKKNKRIGKKKDRKKLIAIVLVVVWIISLLISPFMLMCNWFGWESRTENPDNYLDVDYAGGLYDVEILYIFPRAIPLDADSNSSIIKKYPNTTKYYYRYADDLFGHQNDVFAEWQLFEHSYNEEKDRVLSLDGIRREEVRGDWTCIYFYEDIEDKSEDSDFCYHYRFMLFAYNDKTLTVRYAFTDAHKQHISNAYFNTVEW